MRKFTNPFGFVSGHTYNRTRRFSMGRMATWSRGRLKAKKIAKTGGLNGFGFDKFGEMQVFKNGRVQRKDTYRDTF